ncbi:hypothetical protein TNCT_204331, partial [Trichonephila clavata]
YSNSPNDSISKSDKDVEMQEMKGSSVHPFTRTSGNFFTLTFRELGRNHIASTSLYGRRSGEK